MYQFAGLPKTIALAELIREDVGFITQSGGIFVDLTRLRFDPKALETLQKLSESRDALLAVANYNYMLSYLLKVETKLDNRELVSALDKAKLAELDKQNGLGALEAWVRTANSSPLGVLISDEQSRHNFGLIRPILDDVNTQWDEFRLYRLSKRYPHELAGCVYLFRLSTGHYKIGLSIDPKRRKREVISGLPLSVEIVHTIETNQMRCLERELHEKYREKRHGKTEWFDLDDADVLEIKIVDEMNYPWIVDQNWANKLSVGPISLENSRNRYASYR